MISKYIQRRITELGLSIQYEQPFIHQLEYIKTKYDSSVSKNFILKKICVKFLKICEEQLKEVKEKKIIQYTMAMISLVKEVTFQIYEDNSLQILMIKIKAYVLTLKCHSITLNQKSQTVFLKRIALFLKQIESSNFNQALQHDFYSNLQLLYFAEIREKLKTNEFQECRNYISKCFQMLKTQIYFLNDLVKFAQQKVYQLLRVKTKLFMTLFTLDSACVHFSSSCFEKDLPSILFFRYEKVTDKIPVLVQKKQQIDECMSLFNLPQENIKANNNKHSQQLKQKFRLTLKRDTLLRKMEKQTLSQFEQVINKKTCQILSSQQNITSSNQFSSIEEQKNNVNVQQLPMSQNKCLTKKSIYPNNTFNQNKQFLILKPASQKRSLSSQTVMNKGHQKSRFYNQPLILQTDGKQKSQKKITNSNYRVKSLKKFNMLKIVDQKQRKVLCLSNPFQKLSKQSQQIQFPKKRVFSNDLFINMKYTLQPLIN